MSNSELDWEAADEQCDCIVELIDDEVPERAWDVAADFFDDIRDKVVAVQETITQTNHVTEKQQQALDNWEAGVRKWIKE